MEMSEGAVGSLCSHGKGLVIIGGLGLYLHQHLACHHNYAKLGGV